MNFARAGTLTDAAGTQAPTITGQCQQLAPPKGLEER